MATAGPEFGRGTELLFRLLAASGLAGVLAQASQDHRRPVGKLDQQRQFAANALHIVTQRRKVQVRALLDARAALLADFELLRQARRSEFARRQL